MKEYEWLMEARSLRAVDEDFDLHKQAFLNFQVQATDKKGKPVYRNFGKFYDYKKELEELKKPKKEDKFMALKKHKREELKHG